MKCLGKIVCEYINVYPLSLSCYPKQILTLWPLNRLFECNSSLRMLAPSQTVVYGVKLGQSILTLQHSLFCI